MNAVITAATCDEAARFPQLVLFDLDGTLLDSAPDMLATVNRMRAVRAQGAMLLAELRPHVSRGSRAMSAAAFPELGGEVSPEMIREFLDVYEQELGKSSLLFDGVAELLEAIEADGARWGIITNKPEYLAKQVLHAAQALGTTIDNCVYVGDDQRDIDAARAAGMRSVVALWGYRGEHEQPQAWGGDAMAATVHEMLGKGFWQALR
jgi:phosphoglycolate phosphatase-like HAD superfamily hydrolase